jgi:hypothetical protein
MEKTIFIQLGGAVCHSAVATRLLEGKVDRLTEKAVKIVVNIRNKDYTLWLPLSALKETKGKYSTWYTLAKWFKPNKFQRFIFDNVEVSGISYVN